MSIAETMKAAELPPTSHTPTPYDGRGDSGDAAGILRPACSRSIATCCWLSRAKAHAWTNGSVTFDGGR